MRLAMAQMRMKESIEENLEKTLEMEGARYDALLMIDSAPAR